MDLVREWRGEGALADFQSLLTKLQCSVCSSTLRRWRFEGVPKGSRIKHKYGDEFPVEKLECIGHVQKRMGARLRALKNNFKIHQAVRQQTDIWTRKADRCRNSSTAKILGPSA
ncbi:hypothetical protein TNCV_3346811 [Trichonephila clavipes]|nr:hypothetical protein TNCV_3346811 [Trichonephila clavipes]